MRTARWSAAALVAAVAALAACGDDGGDATGDAPLCADVTAAGRPTADVVADLGHGCDDGDTILFITAVSWECPDGRTVHSSDWGWGFAGDVWQPVPAPYADCVMPGTDAQHP